MNRVAALLPAILLLAVSTGAQALTPAERDRATQYLETTRKNVLDATKGLSPAQWNFKPAPDRWSVAEVVEHIATTEDMLFNLVTQQVMKAPARTEPEDLKALDDLVIARVTDRTHKVQAPEQLRPTNRFGTPDDAVKHFVESRTRTIQYLQTTDGLRAHAMDNPALGKKFDAYQWILFIGAHSERHTKQLNEVKADANFPKK